MGVLGLEAIAEGEAEFPVEEVDKRVCVAAESKSVSRAEIQRKRHHRDVDGRTDYRIDARLTHDKIGIGVVEVADETKVHTRTTVELEHRSDGDVA